MTQQLEKELQEQEAEIILTFRKEFHQLCEKFQMEGIYLGLRPEIKNINWEEGKSAIPGFLDFYFASTNVNKLEMLMKLHGELGDELEDRGREQAFKLLEKIADALEKDDKKDATQEKAE